MRVFHIQPDQFTELEELPGHLPATGYLWIGCARREFEVNAPLLQASLQRWTGGQIVDLHISDLLNNQLPSHFDYTSWYDVMVFRRLVAAGPGTVDPLLDSAARAGKAPVAAIDTSPVGFAVFDRVLVTVHPTDCLVRDFFASKLQQMTVAGDARPETARPGALRLPVGPADLMLRMINHIVDSYLELRRLLTKQLGQLQQELLNPRSHFDSWQGFLDARNALHLLEDTCEDQRSALVEWIDALDEWPDEAEPAAHRERELLRVRSRDVLEHIERVLSHVRRLESSAEAAVQMHFSAQSNRTNDIMRTLTVLTAIFMPLNLITGFFGMNFDALPLIHSNTGVWIASVVMVVVGVALGWYFWRKRYLSTSRRPWPTE